MAQDALFLLSPFQDSKAGADTYFCPDCALVEGILSYHPELKKKIKIHRVGFTRPRAEIISLLGEKLQSVRVEDRESGYIEIEAQAECRSLT